MKKVLILTVIAILALGVMAMANGHVAGTASGASSSTTVTATITVYQWFNYSITGESHVISNVGSSTILKLADAWVKSNGRLHVMYAVSTAPGGLVGLSTWKYGENWSNGTGLSFVGGTTADADFYLGTSGQVLSHTDISLWTNYMSQSDGTASYELNARSNVYTITLYVGGATVTF